MELPTINGVVLEKVCEYLYYNQKHAESKDVPDLEIPPELCLELLIAADYLDGGCGSVGVKKVELMMGQYEASAEACC